MKKICPAPEIRNPNPLAELLADAIAMAVQRPDVIAALRAIYTPAHVEAAPETLLAKVDLAKALNVSTSTIDRLCGEGMPCELVAARKRFNLGVCRTWLASRGQRAAAVRPSDRVDVDSVLGRAGLRMIGGAK
jgi:hypothetical protein